MACVALTSLMATIELEFLQPNPRVSLPDQTPIKSFIQNLSFFQAFLQKESSGDAAATEDFEIGIKDFALKAEDAIEIQLSNFLLSKHTQNEEKAFQELRQTLQEAAENAAELWEMIKRDMPCVALTCLMATIKLEFLQLSPKVSLLDQAPIKFFIQKISSIQAFLQKESSGDGAAITNFALKAEGDIKIQLSNFLLAKGTEYQEKATQELCQTLREAAGNAAELWKIIRILIPCVALMTSCKATVELEFLQLIIRVSLNNEAPIYSLRQTLASFQNFVESISGEDAAIKDLETKIRDFVLRVEDDIDLQLVGFLRAKDKEHQEKASRELHKALQEAAENATMLWKIINSTSNETDEAYEDQPLEHSSDFESGKDDEAIEDQLFKHASDFESGEDDEAIEDQLLKQEDEMVGRSQEFKEIMDQLLRNCDELRLIAVIGMVGIGKTTLAKAVFRNPRIQESRHFDILCWITIPQEYNGSQMLCHILRSIALEADPTKIKMGSTTDDLADWVKKSLSGKRYLIVLDNFWNNQAWDFLHQCLNPNDKNGSRILLTTRHFDQNCYSRLDYYPCNISLLDPKESWCLFHKILTPKKHMASALKNIRSDVVEKCDGLPHAIVTVAERLCECNNIKQEWGKIDKELESLGILDHNALTYGYNQLPQYLKVCFLYFGVFPKRYEISIKVLIRLWIAEGFVKPLEHKELEKQAYEYLQVLINSSLVFIGKRSLNGKSFKTCRMHSALHTFCVGEAQEESILCAANIDQLQGLSLIDLANSCRWLSLYAHSFDYYVLFNTNNSRSIFFFDGNPETFVPLKLLRVLALVPSSFLQRVSMHLGDLLFLRYLSIKQWVEGLDYIVSKMSNLQTLVVSSNESKSTRHLPSGIWESSQLRHLELGNSYTVDPPSTLKENLRTLSWVSSTPWREEVRYMFPNISKLKIYVRGDLEPSHTCGSHCSPIICDKLDYWLRLEKLTISVSVGCTVTLPDGHVFLSKLPSLKELRLSGTNLSEMDLTAIGELDRLKVLKLENAFCGKVWEVAQNGFCRLKVLILEDKNLQQWVTSCDVFPNLERLVLRFCCCLEEIPAEFDNIMNLRSIELVQCHSSIASAKEIWKEKRDIGNDIFELKIDGLEYDESQRSDIERLEYDELQSDTEELEYDESQCSNIKRLEYDESQCTDTERLEYYYEPQSSDTEELDYYESQSTDTEGLEYALGSDTEALIEDNSAGLTMN